VPPVGVDEWAARVEERREQRAGLVGQALAAWDRVAPVWRLVLFAALVASVPFFTDSDFIIRVGVNTLLLAMLALGLNIVVGWAGLLDLGYIAFYGFGAYTYALLASDQIDVHLPSWLAILAVIVASALLGFLLGLPSRRLRRLPGDRDPVLRAGLRRAGGQPRPGHAPRRGRAGRHHGGPQRYRRGGPDPAAGRRAAHPHRLLLPEPSSSWSCSSRA
jgi:hypothetical protein